MNFLKKWLNSITLFISGVLGLVLSLCSGMKTSYSIDASTLGTPYADLVSQSHNETTKAYKVLTDGDLATTAENFGISTEFGVMKAFGVIGVVVSVLLIVWAIVLLLQNLNVIKYKSKAFSIVTAVMPILFLLATVGLLTTSLVYANAQQDAIFKMLGANLSSNSAIANYVSSITLDANVVIGIYQPLILAVSIIGTIIIGTFSFFNLKKANA